MILALNAGSSSIKFALFDAGAPPRKRAAGQIDGIGSGRSAFKASGPGDAVSRPVDAPDHAAAARQLLDWIDSRIDLHTLAAVGHRVVRGAPFYRGPARIDAAMLARLREIGPFDAEHLPHAIALIEAMRERCPELPQVACFDTTFHRGMPRVATLLPIPRRYFAQGVQRYGFHGLSYQFLMRELARLDGAEAARGRIVLAHLGNGASLAAVRNAEPLDCSMGFTPTGGVAMSTRSGDLDPGVLWYLARSESLDPGQLNALLNTQSGLLGISETSADMRELQARERDDIRAAEAVDVFCYRVKKTIGAFAAALGGIDTLVFSGGIGENAPEVRARVCAGLEFLGIRVDAARNAGEDSLISPDGAAMRVRVIRTDEEATIARSVCELLGLDTQTHDDTD